MLNAIGLQGIGVRRFIAERLPELRRLGATVVVNVCGSTLDEYAEVSRILSDAEGVAADRPVVAYCNGGVAATVLLFNLARLGYNRLANYDGSWNEWGARLDLPVEP